MTHEHDHRIRSFRLLASTGLLAVGLLFVLRAATLALAPFEAVVLVQIGVLCGAGLAWVREEATAERWSLGILGFTSLMSLFSHAVVPQSAYALEMLGVVVAFGSLALGPRTFVMLSLALLASASASRGARVYLGLGGPEPILGIVNLSIGYLGFGAVLYVLDRQHRQAAERLTRAMQQAQGARDGALEALEAKTRFLANMSHELRTPLNAILGYAELLEEEVSEDTEEAHELLRRIHEAGSGLLRHLDDVLDAARQEAAGLGHSQLLDSEGSTDVHEMLDVERLARVDRAVGRRGTITAGLSMVVLVFANGLLSEVLGVSGEWLVIGLSAVLGSGVALLGWWGHPSTGMLLLTVGGRPGPHLPDPGEPADQRRKVRRRRWRDAAGGGARGLRGARGGGPGPRHPRQRDGSALRALRAPACPLGRGRQRARPRHRPSPGPLPGGRAGGDEPGGVGQHLHPDGAGAGPGVATASEPRGGLRGRSRRWR
jgi:signal transduction histidine kinase